MLWKSDSGRGGWGRVVRTSRLREPITFLAIGMIIGSLIGIILVATAGTPFAWSLRLLAIAMIVLVGVNL